jgi:hypothetical protein
MKLEDIRFPLYVVHSDEVITRDGLLWCEGAVIDDKNTQGNSLGERRLSTPLKNLYDLKYQISDFGGLIKHRGRFYVDSNGKFFVYEKSKNKKISLLLYGFTVFRFHLRWLVLQREQSYTQEYYT